LHHGKQAGAGHYTSMVRLESERGDSWYKLDDESTSKVTVDDVLGQQQQVYLLFYKHKSSE
jgi:ubiquitin C-terminal hydrolase